jgi:hypothetical protein
MSTPTFLLASCGFQLIAHSASLGQIVPVRQDFSRDPGWDQYQNRIVGTDLPGVVQDFGWRRTGFSAGRARSAGASRTRAGRPTTRCRWEGR